MGTQKSVTALPSEFSRPRLVQGRGVARRIVENVLARAGVGINGPNPWDIRVHDERLYARVLREKNLGLGEAYMDGWWDCQRIDEFICRVLRAGLDEAIRGSAAYLLRFFPSLVLNLQSKSRAHIIAQRHYDRDNDLFLSFLDPYNQYSCAYFQETDDLAEAQEKKLELLCRKLNLQAGNRVLDIGGGWGGLARHMAERHGCTVTSVNISGEQVRYARDFCRGLPVTVIQADYRQIGGTFDKIVSVGMFEHVGWRNYRIFMNIVHRCLKPEGVFLLQTIGGNESRVSCDPWITRYIFPNGMLPSIAQIGRAVEGLFVVEDWHNLGPHYDRTLMAWYENFQRAWDRLKERYDDRFKRMWDYYLLSCAGAFRARSIQLWQIVLTKPGTVQPACRI
ncbi:MAG TPA: cyclopropane fatty acyl phospholipid synthase [Syntrophales bacterium]|nr:cyclopropane fatty acyl phospholipid synthase [Syntrophales bacterium]HPQ07424.1 cyclopropane fatty acyl phospholipid synthase [Syntrophales bacterium]